jgi:hypothetical protein
MSTSKTDPCCPRFDPEPWNEKTQIWVNRRFVKDRVTSILHIPLNFSAVMKRNVAAIEASDAKCDNRVVLSDENSLWGADVYIEASKDIPSANMASISGTFLCKVFEGPYRNMRKWIEEMNAFVKKQGRIPEKYFFYYTTCPKCARNYGRNYVVILAKV